MVNSSLKTPTFSLIFNLLYCVYYVLFGVITSSWWLLTLGVYYFILSTVRFVVVRAKNDQTLAKFTGWMLMILSVPLIGTVILSLVKERGRKYHIIVMLSIATYTFAKITLAIVKLIRSRRSPSQKTITLRNISLADAFVSIFSLQRSMLVTFEGMTDRDILLMNALTGIGVCAVVFFLGFHLVTKGKYCLRL